MIIINFGLTSLATWLEKRLRTRGSGGDSVNGVGESAAPPAIDADMMEGVPGVDDMTNFDGEGKQT